MPRAAKGWALRAWRLALRAKRWARVVRRAGALNAQFEASMCRLEQAIEHVVEKGGRRG